MLKSRRWVLVAVVSAGLLAVSSAAMAEHDDSHPEDTVFSFGYDSVNHVVAVNHGDNDTLYDCGLEGPLLEGPLAATYLPAVEGVIAVDTLDVEDAEGVKTTKTFDPRVQEELAEFLTEVSDPIEYSGAGNECGVSGVVVAGPNGQINHGQFMKAAKSLIDIKGWGCVVRYLAKSDIGKTDETKVATSDVDPLFEVGGSGDITFSTFDADCSRGNKNKNKDVEATNKGKKDRTGSPGKSADAPGKSK